MNNKYGTDNPFMNMFGGRHLQISELLSSEIKRKRAEDKIRRLNSAIDQCIDGIAIEDMEATLSYVNGAFARMHGYTPQEMVGKKAKFLHNDAHMEEFRKAIFKVKNKGSWKGEIGHVRKDGTFFPTYMSVTLLKNQYGRPEGILVICRDITEQKRVEYQLKTSVKEKEVLLKEIHHRVKNNFQLITSLLKIQSQHIKNKQFNEVFKECLNRIKSMAIIHEKLYQSEKLTSINFKVYLMSLMDSLSRSYGVSYKKIRFEIEAKDILLSIDRAIPCGLVVNELVSNSLKHAFPDGRAGKIRIAIHSINGKGDIEIEVSDDGVGIPRNLNFKNTKSLGLNLVSILVEDQLQGDVKLYRNNGTKFQIKLKGVRQ